MIRRVLAPTTLLYSTLVLACSGPPAPASALTPAEGAGAATAPPCDLDAVARRALGQTPGAVIVIELSTGGELVAVSNDNRLDMPLPPASTVKGFLAHAALEGGVVTPSESLACDGEWTRDGRTLQCFHNHGNLDLAAALATSCNAYFYEVVQRLGTDHVAASFEAFGLPGLSKKLRRAPAADRMAIAVGHGSGTVTPRQLAAAFAGLVTTKGPAKKPVHAGMVDAVTADHGTAGLAAVEGLAVAGKTGTAESGDHDHAWFVGYAPAQAPHVLALAYLYGDGTGGSAAAPVAAQVFSAWSTTCR